MTPSPLLYLRRPFAHAYNILRSRPFLVLVSLPALTFAFLAYNNRSSRPMIRSPIVTGSLPAATPGPYKNVGYAYIRTPPLVPYTSPQPINILTGQPALRIEQVGYAVFYPCDPGAKSKPGVTWFPEPVNDMVKGYERFLGKNGLSWLFKALKFVVGRLRFPAHAYAPVAEATVSTTKHPLVIFSHGLAGTRHTYTQYCSALASQGYVVLAVEHRDGSAPAVTLPPESKSSGQSTPTKQEQRVLSYIKKDEIVWEEGEKGSVEKFRTLQLEMRVREVYEAYQSFGRVVQGDISDAIFESGDKGVGEAWAESLRNRVDMSQVELTGHSFGAGTVLHLLHAGLPDDRYTPLPIKRTIALDPWLEPIPLPTASAPPSNAPETLPPVLVINSPGFTVWDTHFRRLLKMTKEVNGSLLTLLGSNHQSFSDFPLLAPTSPTVALSDLETIHSLSDSFLRGRLVDNEAIKGQQPDEGRYEKGPDGKMAGERGRVVVHLLGKQE